MRHPEFSKSRMTFVGENCKLKHLVCPGVRGFCVRGHLSLPAGVREAGRRLMREVPQAGEEHRSPGSRCSTGITSTGKALLPGLAREGGSAGKGLGRGGGRSPHTMGWKEPPACPLGTPQLGIQTPWGGKRG